MNMKKQFLLLALAALSCALFCSSARADEAGGFLSKIGPEAEIYVPFSSKTKDRFGSSFKGLGIGFGSIRPQAGGRFSPDISIMREEQSGDRALLALAGLQYRKTFAATVDDDERYVPYFGAGANLVYGRLRVNDQRDSDFGAGASVFVGTSIGRRAFVEARVRGLSEVADYNFSGVSLSAGLRF